MKKNLCEKFFFVHPISVLVGSECSTLEIIAQIQFLLILAVNYSIKLFLNIQIVFVNIVWEQFLGIV